MREFKDLDTTALKAFYYAATNENFTVAAQKANMTQSGVSQHIAKIEATLGAQLFLRVGRRVQLSPAGIRFKNFVEAFLDDLERAVEDINKQKESLSGVVAYAMPASCRFTPHFPVLLEKRKKFPNIDLRVQFCPTELVLQSLLNGSIDFGFVTKNTRHPDIEFQEFAEEEYVLVGAPEFDLRKIDGERIRELPFIKYPGVDVLFEYWAKTHLSRQRNFSVDALKIKGDVNSLNGAIMMVRHGLGVTVFPRQCVENEIKKKQLAEYSSALHKSSTNMIFIAQLKNHIQPKRVQVVLETFWGMK